MKEIYEVRCRNWEQTDSKCIKAYADMNIAINEVKRLNALYHEYGDPYFMRKKIIK